MKIDNVFDLEGFTAQDAAKPAIKYAFIGLGQGGSKIADSFASIQVSGSLDTAYPVMIINSNLGDMNNLKNVPMSNRFPLKGYERGVGKKPEVGKQAFLENGAELFEEIIRVVKNCQKIYVCGSLGGGTATGIINALIDAIADHIGIPVGAIVSLPDPDEIESKNAFNALSELLPKLEEFREDENERVYRVLENLIILDNQKIIKEHLLDKQNKYTWDFYSNYKVASTLHEWNIITSLPSDITLDAADIENNIFNTGSIITFAKKKIDLVKDVRNKEDLIQQIVTTYKEKNELANGFNYKEDTKALGVCIILPEGHKSLINQDTLEIIRRQLREEIPGGVYVGYATWGSEKYAIVYTIASMSGLPERAKNLREEARELHQKRLDREKKSKGGFKLGDKLEEEEKEPTIKKTASALPFSATTNKENSKAEGTTKKIFNPFKQ
ncbi:MAG: Cell division GTPase [Bacilli bacterium]|nr:Cell division GTPase [Bacilli bacterium]